MEQGIVSKDDKKAYNFQSSRVFFAETDIPGAALSGRKPEELKVEELKRWLKCRQAKTSGNHLQLVQRVKDYISSGLDKKVFNPDGKILEKKADVGSNRKIDEWPKEGWTLNLENIPPFKHCYIFDYLSGGRNEEEKRRGAFKCKREGYALFKASHVINVQFNSSHDVYCFFEAKVKASMTKNKIYRTKVRQNKRGEVVSAFCNCKAGVNGYCKHVEALLYTILDFCESELKQIPPN